MKTYMNIVFIAGFGLALILGYWKGKNDVEIQQSIDRGQQVVEIREEIETLLTVQAIVMCESGAKHNGVWGDSHHRYPAFGIGQFQERTFYWLASKAGFKKAKWNNIDDQLVLLVWAVKNNYGDLWTCYRRLERKS